MSVVVYHRAASSCHGVTRNVIAIKLYHIAKCGKQVAEEIDALLNGFTGWFRKALLAHISLFDSVS